MTELMTIRETCRKRVSLDGVDAEALEHGLTQLEKKIKEMEPKVEFLDALKQAGVDNWVGYSHAFDILGDEWLDENMGKV